MKQKFWEEYNKKFIKYFNLKNSPWEIENNYIKKTVKYLKYIKWIPWLRMVWIWNSIAMNSAKDSSDIDLYIVTSNNLMWFVRIIITFIFQILWVRKNSKNHKWRFCLSFFSTLDWMNFWSFKIDNDIYLYFWIIYFKPILDFNNTYDLFLEKNSSWADFWEYNNMLKNNKTFIKYYWDKKDKKFYTHINKLFKNIFLPKTLKHFNKIWKPYWVVINNNLLKFHNWDIREKIRDELI